MSINESELGRLRGIEAHLTLDDPKLARMLRTHQLPAQRPAARIAVLVALLCVAVALVANGVVLSAPLAVALGVAGLCLVTVRLAAIAGGGLRFV